MQENLGSVGLTPPPGFGPFGRALLGLCRGAAIAGGLVMTGLVAMSIVSIVGRKLISQPVPGDVEVLQMLAAVSVACFFAYCHLKDEDVKVDFFTAGLPKRGQALLDMIGSVLVAGFGALIAWRTWELAMATRDVQETSPILNWPVWIAQAAMVPGFVLLAVAGAYMATLRARRAFGGR